MPVWKPALRQQLANAPVPDHSSVLFGHDFELGNGAAEMGFAVVVPDGPAIVESDAKVFPGLLGNQPGGFTAGDGLAVHHKGHGAVTSQAGFQVKTARWGLRDTDGDGAAMLAETP